MTTLADPTLEHLSDLFASGSMKHAEEIAQLLGQEINQTRPGPETQLACELLRWAVIIVQTPASD